VTNRQTDQAQRTEAPVWIADPGHAWLRVPLTDYYAAEIRASDCSYSDADYVYLEEDYDAGLYISAVTLDAVSLREIFLDSERNENSPRNKKSIRPRVARDVTVKIETERQAMLRIAQDTGHLTIIGIS